MYGNDEAICLELLSKLYQRKDSLEVLSTIISTYLSTPHNNTYMRIHTYIHCVFENILENGFLI